MDVLAVEDAARECADAIRAGEGPQFIEAVAYRFRAHSMFDAELYREKDEIGDWRERGPIVTFVQKLRDQNFLDDEEMEALEARVAAEVQEAVDFAEAGTWEPVEDLTRFVYSERSPI